MKLFFPGKDLSAFPLPEIFRLFIVELFHLFVPLGKAWVGYGLTGIGIIFFIQVGEQFVNS